MIDTRWSSPRFLNLWTKNHLLSADEYKYFESLPDTKSQIFQWKHFARHSFSLIGGIIRSPQTRRVNQRLAALAERWTITEIRRQSNSVLTYSAHRCPTKFLKSTRTRERELIKL